MAKKTKKTVLQEKAPNGLVYNTTTCNDRYYKAKAATEKRLGRDLTNEEFCSSYYTPNLTGASSGTSIFDPVLAELLLKWFSPASGQILDPFAGGSVRGVVSAMLGRSYTGIDLRPEQIEANKRQWATIKSTGARASSGSKSPDYTPELTPIEQVGQFWVKRDDLFCIGGVRGGKVRTCWHLAQKATKGLITAGSRMSPQVNIVAHIANKLGLPCRVHTPEGELSPEVLSAQSLGAEIIQHEAGYNNVIIARAREDAQTNDWTEIPFGMECKEAVEQTRKQVKNIPEGVKRIVMPVGSGMSLSGVLWGLKDSGYSIPVLGVQVGADPIDRLNEFAPKDWKTMAELVKSPLDYHDAVQDNHLGEITLDPIYESKCLSFLQEGDLLWAVGIRQTATTSTVEPVEPQWLTGDSNKVLDTLPADFQADFVLSCPPYADLEVYSDNPDDLSTMDYEQFVSVYRSIIAKACSKLKDNRFACFVVGEVRNKKTGGYLGFVHDTVKAFEDAGLTFYNEAILVNSVCSLAMRVAGMFSKSRKLGKCHQNVLVFVKGDPRIATQDLGAVEPATINEEAD